MLNVRLLGQFDARRDNTPLAIPSRAAQSLLAYLLLTVGTTHRREKLAGLFWPNTLEESARHNLRHELWRIRKTIETGQTSDSEEGYLLADEFSLTFNPNSQYWLDVSVLERATTKATSPENLMTTLSLYRGELLPGFYDDWVVRERERVYAIFEQGIGRLLECLAEEQHWNEILEWGERWIALGQTPEPAYRALMVAHSEMGDKSKVASTFQRCVESLRHDLGVDPSEQTLALFEQLRVGTRTSREKISLLLPRAPMPSLVVPNVRSLVDVPPAPGEPPFKGLEFFDEADADLFFGRELLVAKLAIRVSQDHFFAIVGASGSGKSSIVRAGLVPALKKNYTDWQYHLITPTTHPLEALAATLTRDTASVNATTTLCDDLARDPRSLRLAIKRALERGGASRLVLVVDQFEELYTLCRDDFEREAFIDNLLSAITQEMDVPITVVITLRADFYAHCAQYPDLRDALAEHQEYIGPMSAEELRRAIEEPARRGGWEFEQGLVDLILRDAGAGDEPGALPLLSHALLESWKRRCGRTLTLKGYAESGGVRGAIAQTADTVFNQLTLDQQHIARNIFLRLTELGEGTQDTRRRAAISELILRPEDATIVQSVINKLADARLITTSEGPAVSGVEGTVEVAHEALIREWHTLRGWLNANREGLQLHRHLTESAESWQKLNREPGELYRGARLAQALEWASANADELNLLEREFLDASRAARAREETDREAQRQRELVAAQKLAEAERRRATILRSVMTGSIILMVVMIGLALFAFSQRQDAIAQRDIAENERRIAFARELSVNALSNLDVDSERSILLALHAVAVSTANGKPVLREVEEALHRAVMTSRLRMTLRGHTGYVLDATFSPDGKRIATASQDKTAKIWDAATGNELLTLTGHTDLINRIAFSPDGKRLVTASADQTKVWNLATGKELMTLPGDTENASLAYSPDGRRIVTGCGNETAKVWDAETGKLSFTIPCQRQGQGSKAIASSPDGKRFVITDVDTTPKVWDAETGKALLTLGNPQPAWTQVFVAFSPEGKRIATATREGLVKVWDAMSGRELLSWKAQSIFSIAFDLPFGTRLITGYNDGTVKVWDISSTLTQITSATSGQLLFTLAGHTSSVSNANASPDGRQLVSASADSTARIWDITDSGTSEWITISDGACCMAFYTPDAKRLIGTSRISAYSYGFNRMNVWDAITGQILRTVDVGRGAGLNLSPDGKRFGVVTLDKMATVWDVDTGNQLFSAPTANADDPSFVFYGIAFNPDGTRFATATGKGNITIWDIKSGKEVMTLSGHLSNVNALAYSSDGTRLASNADTVKIWDALLGKELRTLPTRGWSVAFSPDGTRLATANLDGTATVWDVGTGKELQTLRGHTAQLWSVAFSPDSNRLATGSIDSTLKIWNVSSGARAGEQPLTLYGENSAVINAQFSPDGKSIVAGWSYRGSPGSVRVFALDLNDLITIAKSRVTRALTNDECQKFLHMDKCP